MLNSIPFSVVVSILLGFLAGIGVGGGSLLIIWLMIIEQMDPTIAKTINLMFFIAAAGSVSLFRLRGKTICWKQILPAILLGSVSAAAFSVICKCIDQTLIRKLFGILLMITGLRELLYRPRNAR